MHDDDLIHAPGPAAQVPGHADRRRPGRSGDISQELIPILRGSQPVSAPELPGLGEDQLSSMRGLVLALLVSAGIWAVLLRLLF